MDVQRCEECNHELSYCGREGFDGPALDCRVCKQQSEIVELRQQLAEARAAARWIYYEFNQLTDDGANIPLRWPWLAEEQNGGTDDRT